METDEEGKKRKHYVYIFTVNYNWYRMMWQRRCVQGPQGCSLIISIQYTREISTSHCFALLSFRAYITDIYIFRDTAQMRSVGGGGGLLGRRVIVLNAAWLPVGVTNVRNALSLLFSRCDAGEPKSLFLDPKHLTTATLSDIISPTIAAKSGVPGNSHDNMDEIGNIYIRTPTSVVKIPEAIVLSKYHGLSRTDRQRKPKFSRNTLFARDNYRCGYCGTTMAALTVEHILPYSRGGPTSYENCVTACQKCNAKKGARTPAEAGMTIQPTISLTTPKAQDKLAECARLFQQLITKAQQQKTDNETKDT